MTTVESREQVHRGNHKIILQTKLNYASFRGQVPDSASIWALYHSPGPTGHPQILAVVPQEAMGSSTSWTLVHGPISQHL